MANQEMKNPTAKSTPVVCLICFDDSATAGCALTGMSKDEACTHFACRVCMKHYLVQCENDRKERVRCPHPKCRNSVSGPVAKDILGRPYAPKKWKVDPTKTELPDSATLAWLRMNEAQNCGNCNAWFVREDGCECMQCLCGWRFCMECKAPMKPKRNEKGCTCCHGVGDFYDNILHYDTGMAPKVASVEELLQNFSGFYARRKDIHCGDYIDEEWEDEDDETLEEVGVFIGSIFDYEEEARGVYNASCFEYEEPVESQLVPLWVEMEELEAFGFDKDEVSVASSATFQSCFGLMDMSAMEKSAKAVVELDSETASVVSTSTYESCQEQEQVSIVFQSSLR